MVPISLEYFPEISHVYVGITNGNHHVACADQANNLVSFSPERRPTYVTIFHELMHLVQYHAPDMPSKSEEFCSIYAMARMPEHLVDKPEIPYIVADFPYSGLLPGLCRKATRYRAKGNRDYVRYLKRKLEERK